MAGNYKRAKPSCAEKLSLNSGACWNHPLGLLNSRCLWFTKYGVKLKFADTKHSYVCLGFPSQGPELFISVCNSVYHALFSLLVCRSSLKELKEAKPFSVWTDYISFFFFAFCLQTFNLFIIFCGRLFPPSTVSGRVLNSGHQDYRKVHDLSRLCLLILYCLVCHRILRITLWLSNASLFLVILHSNTPEIPSASFSVFIR